jgi:hypothetical protein
MGITRSKPWVQRHQQQQQSPHRDATSMTATAPTSALGSHSAVHMLYSHVLQSVFAFCTLGELAMVMSVSRDWQAPVLQMRHLGASLFLHRFDAITRLSYLCASRLRHHVHSLTVRSMMTATPLVAAQVSELAQSMPHLRSLDVEVACSPSDILHVPLFRLHTLSLKCVASSPPALSEKILETIAQLPLLTHLVLEHDKHGAFPSLLPLSVAATHLRRLDLRFQKDLNESQTAAIQQMSQLHELSMPWDTTSSHWSKILESNTYRLQLCTITLREPSQSLCASLSRMPSLTDLSLIMGHNFSVSFLSNLPQLKRLDITAGSFDSEQISLHDALATCQQLTHLHLTAVAISEDIIECLARMPELEHLELAESSIDMLLAILARMPNMCRKLKNLSLFHCRPSMPVAQLQHLSQLRALEHVKILYMLERELTIEEKAPFLPPSRVLPALRTFIARN